jgi:glycosyltransferase involved in cell wall biosynthesis
MQIHLVTNSYSLHSGGAERLVRKLHRELLARGCNSRLLGLERQPDALEECAVSFALGSAYSPLAFFRLWRYVVRKVEPGDVVHGHLFPTVFYLSLLRLLGVLRARTIMTEHSTWNRRRGTRRGQLIDRITYRGFDSICAISAGARAALVAWRPSLEKRCKVIYNGVEASHVAPLSRVAGARPVILSVGNLKPGKNYATMLRAIARLGDLSFEYQVAGQGPLRGELEALTRALGLAGKVRFLGRVDNINPLLERADVFLMASAWEGFGLAAVEAMHASLPLVISDIPGLAELDNGAPPCSLKVDPDSEQAIADALRALLESPIARANLGAAGFARAGQFSLDAMVTSYLHEYRACHEPD